MATARALDAIFRPRRIAVVGASERTGSPGNVVWGNLRSFPGEVVPVHPSAPTVDGVAAYPSLSAVPGRVDLAVVCVPADRVLDVVRDAAAAGVRGCIVVSAGFSETGPDGAARQQEMVRIAREAGMLVVGPNCLGVQNLDLPMNASLASGTAQGGGGISVLTQSGSYAMALHALSADEGVGFATAYSSGNRADVDDYEVLDYLGRDPGTRVVCAFVESLRDGRAFVETARRVTTEKPVIVTAVGRSEAGARAAASHTAALAANRRPWDGVLGSAGVIVTRTGQEMLDAARVLVTRPLPRGARAAIITNSGGTGTELADLLADEGVTLPTLSDDLRQRLGQLLPGYASSANPVDITPVWTRFAELYPAVLELLARSGEVDLVVPVLLHRSAEDPEVARGIVAAVSRLRADAIEVPVYVCWVARRSAWEGTRPLVEAGIPCLEWPERTARAVGHAVRYAGARHPTGPGEGLPEPRALPPGVGEDLAVTWQFLRDHGIPLVDSEFCSDVLQAVAAAARLDGPAVLKVDHRDLSHKSDVGGVRIGLVGADDVAAAAAELLALAPGARVVVQPLRRGRELMAGGLHDPTFGPLVTFGLGGVLVEVLDDVAFAAAALGAAAADRLLDRPRASRLLGPLRGSGAADRSAVAAVVRAVGNLVATYPQLREVDINPLAVDDHGVVAVDARVVLAG